MSALNYHVRLVIAAICGIAYLATLQQGSLLMLTVLLHGTHEMQLVEKAGQAELVFHHHHDHDDDDDDPPTQGGAQLDDHHHHGDHVIKLASHEDSMVASGITLRVLSATPSIPCLTSLVVIPRGEFSTPLRARPPPLIGSSLMYCLRTTVLVV